MMTLSQFFPLLIGDKVAESDEHWASFLLLIKICSISLSPLCTPDTIPYLRILIEEKLQLFKQLYPDSRLIPKFHYTCMLHYPSQIERFGPLVHSWTMRQESKLSFVKRVSKRGNYKNVPQTVAKKHQLWQCYKFQVEKSYLHSAYECSPKRTHCRLQTEDEHVIDGIIKRFPTIPLTTITYHPAWLKNQAILYRKGLFVLLVYDLMSPKFGKIQDIAVVNDLPFLSLMVFESEGFFSHYNSYQIKPTSSMISLPLDDLSFVQPVYSKKIFLSSDKNVYIVLPFSF